MCSDAQSDHLWEKSEGKIAPEEYVLCSIRARIDSDYCGCEGPYELFGTERHKIGFDCTIRGKECVYAKILSSELTQLFKANLISLSLGQENAAQPR